MPDFPEIPGEYEDIDSVGDHFYGEDTDYLTNGRLDYRSYLMANTDVDSYENPLAPTIGMDADNKWILLWHYTDNVPELNSEYEGNTRAPYYSLITDRAEFEVDFGSGYFDDDLDIAQDEVFPRENESRNGVSISVGAPVGPITVGASIALEGSTVSTDYQPNEYMTWDFPTPTFPDSKDNAAGIAFDLEANSREADVDVTASWSHGFNIVKYNERAQSTTLYTRQEGETYNETVKIR